MRETVHDSLIEKKENLGTLAALTFPFLCGRSRALGLADDMPFDALICCAQTDAVACKNAKGMVRDGKYKIETRGPGKLTYFGWK